jgi:hypothetical protein
MHRNSASLESKPAAGLVSHAVDRGRPNGAAAAGRLIVTRLYRILTILLIE